MSKQAATSIQSWIITFAITAVAFFSFALPLICIFAMPDHSVRPFEGVLYFWGGVVVLIIFMVVKWKVDLNITPENQVIVRMNLSDKILKWFVTILSGVFCMMGFMIGLVCIFALPNQEVEANASVFYFLGCALIVASIIFSVWKNTVNKRL